jgi:hypothetical protein
MYGTEIAWCVKFNSLQKKTHRVVLTYVKLNSDEQVRKCKNAVTNMVLSLPFCLIISTAFDSRKKGSGYDACLVSSTTSIQNIFSSKNI